MRHQDKCCRSLQWITREKESFLRVFVENTTKNPIVPSFSLFRCIFCCFLVSQILAMPNPHPRSGFGKVCRIKRWKCFGIAPWIYLNNFEKFFATDGAVVCDKRTKKLLIPKVTNKQTTKTRMATDAKHIISFSGFSPAVKPLWATSSPGSSRFSSWRGLWGPAEERVVDFS